MVESESRIAERDVKGARASWARLLREVLQIPADQRIEHVEIRHDGWCPIFRGAPCACEPEIWSGPLVNRMYGERPR